MSGIVNASLICILSITNSSHPALNMGTSISYSYGDYSKIVYDNYFNQTYMFSTSGNGKMRAIKVLLPFLDLFYDDNVIPMEHDVVIKNLYNYSMNYNPYYFAQVDSYNGYFETIGQNIDSQLTSCQFVRDYLVEYFSTIGYGTNQTNEYYDLVYYGKNYLQNYNELSGPVADLLNDGYVVFSDLNINSSYYRFALILGLNNDAISFFDLNAGIITSYNCGTINGLVAFKLNTSHYCSDNYYSYNRFKCMGCGSIQNVHHDHYTDQVTPEAYTHKLLCKLCNEMVPGNHTYSSMRYYNLMYHEKTCDECGYVAREAHYGGAGGNSCPCRLTNIYGVIL